MFTRESSKFILLILMQVLHQKILNTYSICQLTIYAGNCWNKWLLFVFLHEWMHHEWMHHFMKSIIEKGDAFRMVTNKSINIVLFYLVPIIFVFLQKVFLSIIHNLHVRQIYKVLFADLLDKVYSQKKGDMFYTKRQLLSKLKHQGE